MARQKGIISVEGPLGDLSFYSSVYGDIVRRKGGASKAMIRKSPRFVRLREHQAEFSACAAAGKLFRHGLQPCLRQAPDHTVVWRVTKLMNQLKDLDLNSVRGERKVEAGLKSKAGKELMKGFELNSQAPLGRLLKRPVELQEGKVLINRIVPKRDLIGPKGASHVELKLICLRLDLAGGKHQKEEEVLVFKLDAKSRDLLFESLTPKGKGFLIYVLQLRFLQEVNSGSSVLENKKFNCLEVIGVE